jgi:hypothetical protein
MKLAHRIVVAALASVASVSLIAAMCSGWYLWHVASRVPDPSRGLVHSRLLGTYDEGGTQFTVYLTSTESTVVFPELYFIVCGIALVLLALHIRWRMALRKL